LVVNGGLFIIYVSILCIVVFLSLLICLINYLLTTFQYCIVKTF